MARPWNPNYTHEDRERWICIYPCYLNSKKSLSEGRKLPKDKCVENPMHNELKDVCAQAGLVLGVENKVHPKEQDPRDNRYRGRIRVQLKEEDGSPMQDLFPTRRSILLYLGETIPKLKSRIHAQGQASSSGTQQGGNQQKKNKKKGKK